MRNLPIIFLFMSATFTASGQEKGFEWKCQIPGTEKEGFHRISLPADILAKCGIDLRDLRIINEKGEEVPWISKTASKEIQSYQQIPLRIVKNSIQDGCCTEIILESPMIQALSRITFSINNAEVKKSLNISGSDDMIRWYVVKEEAVFEKFYIQEESSVNKTLWFPPSSYRYFRILIDDSLSLPLKINQAFTQAEVREWGSYTPAPEPEFSRTDSAGKTFIRLSSPEAYPADRFIFHVQKPALYHRDAKLYYQTGKKGKEEWLETASFVLSAKESSSLDLGRIKERQLLIEIDNNDNPPLQIEKIQPFFLETSLVAYLQQGEEYSLIFGNGKADFPQYDLKYFTDLIPGEIPVLEPAKPEPVGKTKVAASPEGLISDTLWIWAAIIPVISILLFMSVRMVREVQKTNKNPVSDRE